MPRAEDIPMREVGISLGRQSPMLGTKGLRRSRLRRQASCESSTMYRGAVEYGIRDRDAG